MRVDSLTFLRFVAAFMVVLFHFGRGSELVEIAPNFLTAGPQMVTFFFVLSGYVLVLAYHDRNLCIWDYYVKRVARLAPAYFVALVLYLSLLPSLHDVPGMAILLNFTLLQSWFPPYPVLINSPGWSLSVEMFFYAIFPLVLGYVLSRRIEAKILLAGSLALWLLTQIILCVSLNTSLYGGYPSISHDLIFYFPLSHLCSFLIGISGAFLFLRFKTGISGIYPALMFLLLAGITFIALEYERKIFDLIGISLPTASSLWAPLFLALIISLSFCRNLFTRALSSRPCIILGEASYSLYILQWPIFMLYRTHIMKDSADYSEHDLYMFLVFLVISSVISYYTVERLGRRILVWIFSLGRGLVVKDSRQSAAVAPEFE